MTSEAIRLRESDQRKKHWKRWGPYLSERAWGTVREDYSATGEAWDYFPHDHARSRAYRWGEDGLLGISDNHQRLCFALALWNEQDPILKERVFGLTGSEGNHGEDVKDYYFYLDSTPTHSYMKGLYKYPQGEFPYGQLVEENRRRGRRDSEFELVDTGLFAEDRYFDVRYLSIFDRLFGLWIEGCRFLKSKKRRRSRSLFDRRVLDPHPCDGRDLLRSKSFDLGRPVNPLRT